MPTCPKCKKKVLREDSHEFVSHHNGDFYWDCNDYEQQARDREAKKAEDARRLARYDEAIRLLREALPIATSLNGKAYFPTLGPAMSAFLAAEPKGSDE